MFSTLYKANFKFSVKFIFLSPHAFHLYYCKILSLGRELTNDKTYNNHMGEDSRITGSCIYHQPLVAQSVVLWRPLLQAWLLPDLNKIPNFVPENSLSHTMTPFDAPGKQAF